MHKSCIRTLPVLAAAVFGFAFTHAAFAADNTNRTGLRTANSGYGLSHVTEVREPGHRDHRGDRGGEICCKRGRREWWSSPRQCRRSGGAIVSQRVCRRGHDGGHHGNAGHHGRNVCCKWRRHADGRWTSRRRCIRTGGHIAHPRACRHGGRDHRDGGHRGDVRDHRAPHL